MAFVSITLVILLFLLLLILALVLLLVYLWLQNRNATDPYNPPRHNPIYPPEQFFIQNQLIVSGSAATLDRLPGLVAARARGVALTELDRLDFSGPEFNLDERCVQIPDNLVIVKFKISGERASVFRAVRVIDDVMEIETGAVIREPNWVIGQPYEIEGAPYEIEGAPYEIEGATATGVDPLDVPADDFTRQWAFGLIGLPDAAAKRAYQGAGVRVGVFDSSPYLVPAAQVNQRLPKTPPLKVKLPAMNLEVCRVFSPDEPGQAAQADSVDTTNAQALRKSAIRNHGLFVSGLIHAIAPQSSLYLYRVLDSHNRGDLFLLLKGIHMFLRDIVLSGEQANAVINMSLVVRAAPGDANYGLSTDLLSLNMILEVADCLGVVAVSAAGNSSGKSAIPLPSGLPGGMSGVLSVAANNQEMQRACFSNCGDVAAPGGDGRALTTDGEPGCKPRISDCEDATCAAALIGPAIREPFDDENDTHYILWSGSSFSAPLASGLAALVVQSGGGAYSPSQVRKLIMCNAIRQDEYALGAGVIQIPTTLEASAAQKPAKAA